MSESAADILELVCLHHKLQLAQLCSQARDRPLVRARFMAWALMRIYLEPPRNSLPRLGKLLGDRHHTTVLGGLRKHDILMETDGEYAAAFERLVGTVENSA